MVKTRQQTVREYFDAWIKNDSIRLSDMLTDNVFYRECFGPEYHGLKQVLAWFADWHMHGTVLEWKIKSLLSEGEHMAVEWKFFYEYDGKRDTFNGVSLIRFKGEKIAEVKEFESKSEQYYPYEA